jgi:hypothetical protein
MLSFDRSRVRFTEHMTEAAAVVAECHVVLDFGPAERAVCEIKVFATLEAGGAEDPYFAIGANPDDLQGFAPWGGGPTPGRSRADLPQQCRYPSPRAREAGERVEGRMR